MKMRLMIVACMLVSGCATSPVDHLVNRDLKAAIKIADVYGNAAGKKCWEDLLLFNAQEVDGVFSLIERNKHFPMLEACLRK